MMASPAHAVLKIDVTRGISDPMPIAIPTLSPQTGAEVDIAHDITEVIKADLKRSGLFRPLNPNSFIQKIDSEETIPRFADWRQINANALVTGSIKPKGSGKVEVSFRLWDVLEQKQFAGKSFVATKKNWRRVSHMVADEIYSRITGEEGYFDSRIVYVAEKDQGRGKPKIKRLAMMDQDGANHIYLSGGKDMILTPRFSPTRQQIIYLAYHGRVPKVYLYDIETGKERSVGNFEGMSFAPRFSPDGKRAVMSVSLKGNSEIFELNLSSGASKRLTFDPGIDTSPSYSPKGDKIVFHSDRGGSQKIYVMDADGSNVKRISNGKGSYATPVWSPRGDLVAFTKMRSGKFHIGVMRPDGSRERLLTESFLDEGPTWAPNGRVLMFGRQERGTKSRQGISQLYMLDAATGFHEVKVNTPGEASDPAWGPLLSK
jgi:TolB protein